MRTLGTEGFTYEESEEKKVTQCLIFKLVFSIDYS